MEKIRTFQLAEPTNHIFLLMTRCFDELAKLTPFSFGWFGKRKELSNSGNDNADAGFPNEECGDEEYPAQTLCAVSRPDMPGNTDAHG